MSDAIAQMFQPLAAAFLTVSILNNDWGAAGVGFFLLLLIVVFEVVDE